MINLLKNTLEDLQAQREEIQLKINDCEKCIDALGSQLVPHKIEAEAIKCTYTKEPFENTFDTAIRNLLAGKKVNEGMYCQGNNDYEGQMRQPELFSEYNKLKPRPNILSYEEFKIMIRHSEKKRIVDVDLMSRNTNVVSLIK